jgi:hypothetical protein
MDCATFILASKSSSVRPTWTVRRCCGVFVMRAAPKPLSGLGQVLERQPPASIATGPESSVFPASHLRPARQGRHPRQFEEGRSGISAALWSRSQTAGRRASCCGSPPGCRWQPRPAATPPLPETAANAAIGMQTAATRQHPDTSSRSQPGSAGRRAGPWIGRCGNWLPSATSAISGSSGPVR